MTEPCADLERFMRGELDAASFAHRDHLRMGYEMLRRYDFPETLLYYSRALRTMTTRVGRPQLFHQTLTVAFLSLIAERTDSAHYPDFDAFAQANPDLLDKSALASCYPSQRLATDTARRTFVLPMPAR
jgi:hypothetical protein